jgi:hypothetical protein
MATLHNQPATDPFNVPAVSSFGYTIRSTAPVIIGGSIWLDKNPYFFAYRNPLDIYTVQEPSTTPGVVSLGQTHWIDRYATPASFDANVTLDLTILNKCACEDGAYLQNVYNRTVLSGLKNVTLWKWTRTENPSEYYCYYKVADLLTNAPWSSERSIAELESINLGVLNPGYYFIKVDVHVDSLEYWDYGSSTFVLVSPSLNPFNDQTYTYREHVIVTERTDLAGQSWTPYQLVPDLWTDIKDVRKAAKCFGAYPGQARWNPQMDLVQDYTIDMKDIRKIGKDFGWTAPP